MLLHEIVNVLESYAPLRLQEPYDNAGLQTGYLDMKVRAALLTIDVTEAVIDEALEKGTNLIIAHHPLIFGPLKRLTNQSPVERMVARLIREDIALYVAHTNVDNILTGVNALMAQKLKLNRYFILRQSEGKFCKLVTFVPTTHADAVREVIFDAGAGVIGNYDSCSYNLEGTGTFRAGEGSNPFIGNKGQMHLEPEVRIETILPHQLIKQVVRAMIDAHPYEEVAYDLYPVLNTNPQEGAGLVGELDKPVDTHDFLLTLKQTFGTPCIRHSPIVVKKVKRVALCGGSGSFLIGDALAAGADIFITADVKYSQFFEVEDKMILADIGHYESEQFTKEIFYEVVTKKFPNFALHFSDVKTNPINYC